ncbi:MAG: family 20 glycosylhydrolase [Bacteroidetes bacterium]|nr:family 20 glycosylhydrolase [Bacteroidota bacterium]
MNSFLLTFLLSALTATALFAQPENLMPVPSEIKPGQDRFLLTSDFSCSISGTDQSRVLPAVSRLLKRLSKMTTLTFDPDTVLTPVQTPSLQISFQRAGKLTPGESESYQLNITRNSISLSAETDLGILHGLETLYQLTERSSAGFFFRSVSISDSPRFPWRGLMLDVCRHFFTAETVKRQIDAMSLVKLNVLHLHLSEDQGFRIESKTYPKLHELGSNGQYFTQDEMRDLIRYADLRGIRVMPEFDMPGHTTAWMAGYPELGSVPGPVKPEKRYGIFGSTMNPAKPETYTFLDTFLTEMSGLFPDEYFHIGGDENNGEQWDANPDIQKFKTENNLATNHDLQAYFNGKILDILTRNGKKMMGWDEIYQPSLPRNIVIHSWRGRDYMENSARDGYRSVLSNGYYIDLFYPAEKHYLNDPVPAASTLTDTEKARILGGEATMWAELVDEETLDMRIWPRTAAIAERLWSPGSVTDPDEMYRRLPEITRRLEETGLNPVTNRDKMLRRLAGTDQIQALKTLLNAVEPIEGYKRHSTKPGYTTFSPFSRGVDCALSDAPDVIKARLLIRNYKKTGSAAALAELTGLADAWISTGPKIKKLAESSPAVRELVPLAGSVSRLGVLFKSRLKAFASGKTTGETKAKETEIASLSKPVAELEPVIARLFDELKNHPAKK